MAIFSKKQNNEDEVENTDAVAENSTEAQNPVMIDVAANGLGNKGLVLPRLSEKAGFLGKVNQYVFTIHGNLNKIEVRSAIEKMYGVKIANINMINVAGKTRRYGATKGKKSDYKKAVVTLTANSKKIDLVEPS